jgi:hypothetical protein
MLRNIGPAALDFPFCKRVLWFSPLLATVHRYTPTSQSLKLANVPSGARPKKENADVL